MIEPPVKTGHQILVSTQAIISNIFFFKMRRAKRGIYKEQRHMDPFPTTSITQHSDMSKIIQC